MFEEQIEVGVRNNLLEESFKDLLRNCPKIPSPKKEILSIYQNYIKASKFDDRRERLKTKILKANQQAIIKQFTSYMHSIFIDLQIKLPKISTINDLSQLDIVIEQNLPQFIFKKGFKISQYRKQIPKQNQMKKVISEITPKQDLIGFGSSQKFKTDVMFGYIFDILHILSDHYQKYYELEDCNRIQNAIYQGFYSYTQENQSSLLAEKDKQGNPTFNKKQSQSSIKFEKSQKQLGNQEENSQIFNDLINVMLENVNQKKLIKDQNQDDPQNRHSSLYNIKLGQYQVNPLEMFGSAYLIFENIYKKGLPKVVNRQIQKMRAKKLRNSSQKYSEQDEQQKAMKVANTILKSHIRHNINVEAGLDPEQFLKVQKVLKQTDGLNKMQFSILDNKFNQEEKQIIIQAVSAKVQQQKLSEFCNEKLSLGLEQFLNIFLKSKTRIDKNVSSSKKGVKITLANEEPANTLYFICCLYKVMAGRKSQSYSPAARKMILKICHQVENKFQKMNEAFENKQYTNFSLVHSLKVIQSYFIRREGVLEVITNQKPFRQSTLPLSNQRSIYFKHNNLSESQKQQKDVIPLQKAQLDLQYQLSRISLYDLKKQYKEPAKLQLLKLTHSKNKKNVTILISGFLSEDTNKFQQWMGILGPTYDSEIYALKWESKNIQSIMEFTINTCRDIVLAGTGASLIGGPYVKAAFILKEVFNKYQQNPFTPTFEVANITGIFFAHLLISMFQQNHFINLVGFSLGTQVILSTIRQLKKHHKLHLINRIITLGGVADKGQMLDCMQNSSAGKQKKAVEISWTNVYCQKDNILRYLLRVSMPYIDPIGLSAVQKQSDIQNKQQKQIKSLKKQKQANSKKRYVEVDNINVSDIVSGHLAYRTSMKTIGRLVGIKDE